MRALALTLALALPLGAAAQTQRVMITAGGDVLLGGSKAKKTDVYFESFIDQYGDGYVFKNYLPLFSTDDITIVNPVSYTHLDVYKRPVKVSHGQGNGFHARVRGVPSFVRARVPTVALPRKGARRIFFRHIYAATGDDSAGLCAGDLAIQQVAVADVYKRQHL